MTTRSVVSQPRLDPVRDLSSKCCTRFFQFPKMINLNIFAAPRNHFMYCIFPKLDLSSSSNYLKYKLTNRLDLSCQTLCILQKKESFEGREEGALISKRHGPVFCNRRYLQKYQHSRQIENDNLGFNSDSRKGPLSTSDRCS